MAVELTPLGKVVVGTFKWVLVPVAVGCFGLKCIGPNIGGSPKKAANPSAPKIQAPPQSDHAKKFMQVREQQP